MPKVQGCAVLCLTARCVVLQPWTVPCVRVLSISEMTQLVFQVQSKHGFSQHADVRAQARIRKLLNLEQVD